MKLPGCLTEKASIKIIVFTVVFLIIFVSNLENVLDNFEEENIKHVNKIRSDGRVAASYLNIISSMGEHLYMSIEDAEGTPMARELEDIEYDSRHGIRLGISYEEEGERRVEDIDVLRVPPGHPEITAEELKAAYYMLFHAGVMKTSLESRLGIYYLSESGILSQSPIEGSYFRWQDAEMSFYKGATLQQEERFPIRTGYSIQESRDMETFTISLHRPVYSSGGLKGILLAAVNPQVYRERGVSLYIYDRRDALAFLQGRRISDREAWKIIEGRSEYGGIKRVGLNYVWYYRMNLFDGTACYAIPVYIVYYRALKDSSILLLLAVILWLIQNDTDRKRRSIDEKEKLITKLKEAKRALEEISEMDYLTSIYNRRGFLKRARGEYSRFKRSRVPFSIILCDIDHFKRFNDENGHECGDEVLKGVSEILKTHIRETDILARWGGEEFIIILGESNGYYTYRRAEKLRIEVEKSRFVYGEKELSITMTFGVSEASLAMSLGENINMADQALYVGKNTGRNRVELIKEGKSYSLL